MDTTQIRDELHHLVDRATSDLRTARERGDACRAVIWTVMEAWERVEGERL